MGWQGAPPNFQRSMDLLLHGIQGLHALCYIDDLLIFSNSFNDHVEHTVDVCARLAAAGRSVRLEKAQWAHPQVKFLGFHVGHGKVSPIPSAVDHVLRIPTPDSESQLRTILGAFGVYRRFLPHFAQLAAPLFKCLTKQTAENWAGRWTPHCDESLAHLRLALEQATSLHLHSPSAIQSIYIECDRAGFSASFLEATTPAAQWRPIQFLSGCFRGGDCNKTNAERVVLGLSLVLRKMVAVLNPRTTLSIFTTEPAVDWALEPIHVTGKAQKAAMHLAQVNIKLSQPPSYLRKWSAMLRLNDPDAAEKDEIAQRHRIVAQQRVVHLEEFVFSKDVLHRAIVLTFDGGYRANTSLGGHGWSAWSVDADAWTLLRAEGHCTHDATTVNREEFSGLHGAITWVAQHHASTEIHVFGDSKLIVGALQKRMKLRAGSLIDCLSRLNKLLCHLPKVKFWHIRRDFNQVADFMANQAMDTGGAVVVDGPTAPLSLELQRLHHNSLNDRIYAQPMDLPILAVTRSPANSAPVSAPSAPCVPPTITGDLARVRTFQLQCPWMKHMIRWFEKNEFPHSRGARRSFKRKISLFQMYNSVLWYVPLDNSAPSHWRLVLPEPLRADVMREFHDNAGHLKGPRFVKKVQDRYFWPNLSADVQRYDQGCVECQRGKSATWRQTVPLSSLSELTWRPFQTVAVDSVVNLPTSVRGNKHLIVIVDYFSRWPVAIPVPDLSMLTWVRCFTEHFIVTYGCPERLVSDRGGQFVGDLAMALYRYFRIHKNSTTAYHPMSNGLAERFNQTIIHGLKTMISEHQKDWTNNCLGFCLHIAPVSTQTHNAVHWN